MDLESNSIFDHDRQVKKLQAEIERLRAALEELRILGVQGAPPDYTRWLAFHDKVAEIATKALNEQ